MLLVPLPRFQFLCLRGELPLIINEELKLAEAERAEVRNNGVPVPITVRNAWADNPVWNLISADDLPVTPFRRSDFPLSTADIEAPGQLLPTR